MEYIYKGTTFERFSKYIIINKAKVFLYESKCDVEHNF